MPRAIHGWEPSLGAILEPAGVRFRVWAPDQPDLTLVLEGPTRSGEIALEWDGEYRTVFVPGLERGGRYRYRAGDILIPDPCSRSQPDGVHGSSEVVDPAYGWSDAGFAPPAAEDLVVYEAHIGTLTPEGTFASAGETLERLSTLGVNSIELMPVAAFPGRWNWGYDGVSLYSPAAPYGGPEGLRGFVNRAHEHGLAVILDVVYNHFGPDGNYTGVLSRGYTTAKHHTPWGDAVNFDDRSAAGTRQFFRENLLHWVHEYHIDGFRFDATHAIFDSSPEHVLAELANTVMGAGPGGRTPFLIAESHENDVRYLRERADGGFGFDAVWADDFHHAVRTLLHDEHEGYLAGYAGSVEELAATVRQGFLYEGQEDAHARAPRGTPAREQPWRQFLICLQNHDQIGNRAFGLRLHMTAGSERYLAATLLFLLLPQTPMLFQGQEFLASTPFLYFTDHSPELGALVTEGRRQEFRAFSAFSDPHTRELIPDPQGLATFLDSKLRLEESERGAGALSVAFHRELLRLRAADPVLRAARRGRSPMAARAEGQVLVVDLTNDAGRAVIVANFGRAAELALEGPFEVVLSSDEARFGGLGRSATLSEGRLRVPAHTALLLREGAAAPGPLGDAGAPS